MNKKSKGIEKFTIGLIQMSVSNDIGDNLKKAIDRIGEAAKKGSQVICLPELFRSQVLLPAGRREVLRSGRNDSRSYNQNIKLYCQKTSGCSYCSGL